jgi:hypothetical protein
MLVKALVSAVFHDARVRVSEVVLIFVARLRLRRFRCPPARLAAMPQARFLFPRLLFGFVVGFLSLVAPLCVYDGLDTDRL